MRLDAYLVKINKYESRNKAQNAILGGEVLVDGKQSKPSFQVDDSSNISFINNVNHFVSVGGEKLSKALKDFKYSVENLNVVDIGASTGGFTDCLLKNGAKTVCAIDVGENQLHPSLKTDKRVIIKDNVNARYLTANDFSFVPDLITVDVSFISLKYVLPAISNILTCGRDAICLIKPQFELNEKLKLKNGILKDKKIQLNICEDIYNFAISLNLTPTAFTTAPIVKDKNTEFLILLKKDGSVLLDKVLLANSIK